MARRLSYYLMGTIWANRAWALAQLGRHSEAGQALDEAFAVASRSFIPEYAGIHYRAGEVELLRRDGTKAAGHWSQAARLDPEGHYGRLAKQALDGLGV